MNTAKLNFLKFEFLPLLSSIKTDEKPRWGVMNLQQMVEHFAEAVKIASGKLILPKVVEGDNLERNRQFMMTDIPFKENTKNKLLPEEPRPVERKDLDEAMKDLSKEFDYFFKINEEDKNLQTDNPFFGSLNFEQNVQLLDKHAKHHLKQFGIE